MEYREFRRILRGSKEYRFVSNTVLEITGYYSGESVRIDLSAITPEVFEEIVEDEEVDE